MSPELEVRIIEKTVLSTDLAARAVTSTSPITFKAPEAVMQSIGITARRSSARVGNIVRLVPSTYPFHLNWLPPQKMDIETLRGEVLYRQSPRYLELEKDDEQPVWIWVATRGQDHPARILLNVDPPVSWALDMKEGKIDIDIQFIPVEKDPRRFRLEAKSWDGLSLVGRTS
jgi:hypothetical protein